jgi:uncharacterized membrane protein YeaQ/YmgE (transglycosylase-associated protein family)
MDFLLLVILLAVQGLVIGAFARLALPGKDPLSLFETMGVGIAGSLIAGIIFYLIFGDEAAPGFLGALVFSVLIVYLTSRRHGGGLARPRGGEPPRRY